VVKGPDVARTVTLVAGYEGGGGVRVRHHVVIVSRSIKRSRVILRNTKKDQNDKSPPRRARVVILG
jgi:hypothetical protein